MENNIKPESAKVDTRIESSITESTPSDRHLQEDPFSKTEPMDPNDTKSRGVISVGLSKTISRFNSVLNTLTEEFMANNLNNDERDAIATAFISAATTLKNNMYAKKINEDKDDYVNDLVFGDKKLNPRAINFSSNNTNISTATAVAKLTSFLSVGSVMQVPLWHSGFWVTLKPPVQREIINLELSITQSQIELGRDTNTLIFSNYAVVFNRILTDFIIDHISDTTIALPDGDISKIRDYINVQDFNILVTGLLDCLYPDGINVIRACNNVMRFDNNNKPKCDYKAQATLDPRKLIWVNRKVLNEKMMTHMSKKSPGSVSIEQVREYQLSIKDLIDKTYDIVGENGNVSKVTFSLPSLAKYIDMGEKWVNDIIAAGEKLFTDLDTEERRNERLSELASAAMLASYNTFVKQIEAGDLIITDQEAISKSLEIMTSDDKVFEEFMRDIRKFIELSSIAIVATPSYICPKCKAEQNEDRTGPFKEFIPLNVGEYFFLQCGLKSSTIRARVN